MAMWPVCCRVLATSYASCMRSKWSMSGPNAFSMRRAISGVNAALPCNKSESVARRTFKSSAAFDTLRPRASTISVLIRSPGWGGFFMGIAGLLMVVDQVNIAGSVRLFVVAEDQPPVSSNSQAPEASPVAFQGMQLPARKPVELLHLLRGLQGEQQLAQLVGHRRGHPFGVPFFVELLQPLMAKAYKSHVIPAPSSMYG